eukprot:scaffold28116_cov110-Isochrysis_galbana.AAC.4
MTALPSDRNRRRRSNPVMHGRCAPRIPQRVVRIWRLRRQAASPRARRRHRPVAAARSAARRWCAACSLAATAAAAPARQCWTVRRTRVAAARLAMWTAAKGWVAGGRASHHCCIMRLSRCRRAERQSKAGCCSRLKAARVDSSSSAPDCSAPDCSESGRSAAAGCDPSEGGGVGVLVQPGLDGLAASRRRRAATARSMAG